MASAKPSALKTNFINFEEEKMKKQTNFWRHEKQLRVFSFDYIYKCIGTDCSLNNY